MIFCVIFFVICGQLRRLGSKQQHGVTVAEKAVALADGVGIGSEDELASVRLAGGGEGGDKHEEGGLGEVEVGEERVHGLEAGRGMEEKAGAAVAGNERAVVLRGDALEDACGGGADGEDASSGGAGAGDEGGGVGGEFVAFFVHLVLGEGDGLHGRERAEADVEGHEGNVCAGGLDLREDAGREVKSGGRGGDRAGGLRVDGLVAFAVGGGGVVRRAMDVGWQRGFAKCVKGGGEVFRAGEFEAAVAVGIFFAHDGGEGGGVSLVVGELDRGAGADAFAGAEERPPVVGGDFFGEEQLDLSAGVFFVAAEARRNDAGIVED